MQFSTELKLPQNFHTDNLDEDKCIVQFSLEKNFDIYASADLFTFVQILIKGGVNKILVDLQNVEYLDSSGIGIFIKIAKALRASKGDVAFLNVSDNIKKVFSLVKLERFINMFSTEFDAIGYLRLK